MKYGLLTYDDFSQYGGKNIGDYIQSLAAKQFIPDISGIIYVKRDHLNEYNGDTIKLIMNGWYSHYPENFKPSNKIKPLFIAIHINSSCKDKILTKENILYLKEHAPIGCRDRYTLNLLQEKGISAYFSGCLTLTLGLNYYSPAKNNEIIFCDPYIGIDLSIRSLLSCIKIYKRKSIIIKHICCSMFKTASFKNLLKTLLFYKQYSELWSEKVLDNATYINHMFRCNNEEEYFKTADELIRKYARAKLIVTSRIHVALPATGLETPVIFIKNTHDKEFSTCRFDGLIDLFNMVNHDGKTLHNDNKIDVINPIIKKDYISLKEQIIETCNDFMAH